MYPDMVIEIESLYKNKALCHKEFILTYHGTLTMERYPSYCPSGLNQGKIPTKTNKYNHFKQTEAEPPETLSGNRKSIMKLWDFAIRKTHLPSWTLSR